MSSADDNRGPGPVGIGGWLILPILGFIGTILLTCFNLLQGLAELQGLRNIFLAESSSPLASLRLPMIASLVLGFLVIASAAYCLVLVFSKKAAVVKFATIHYLLLMAAGFADVWMEYQIHEVAPTTAVDPTTMTNALRGVVAVCIWIPYFHVSKRVWNTFIRPNAQQAAYADATGNLGAQR
jgi:hypothetical protein